MKGEIRYSKISNLVFSIVKLFVSHLYVLPTHIKTIFSCSSHNLKSQLRVTIKSHNLSHN